VSIRAVFFDAGETLVHAEPSFPELLALTLKAEGFDVDPATVRSKVHTVSEHFDRARRAGELWTTSMDKSRRFWFGVYRTFLGELGLPYSDALAGRLFETFTDLANYRLFDDVEACLRDLEERDLILGVVSNFEEWLERLLESLGVTDHFDVRIISGVEGMEKPDPGLFRLALDRTGVRAEESAYVGDIPMFDTEPAAALGMHPVLIDRRDRYPDYPGPGPRITRLDDLPAAIGLPERART
jgi:putative hydrolase of the HAD superfamily